MRRVVLLAMAISSVVACQREAFDATSNDLFEVEVVAGVSSSEDTRMGVAPDSDNDRWFITWNDGDNVGGWSNSSMSSVAEFSMVDYGAEASTFAGLSTVGRMRLIYPYDATAVEGGIYTIDLSRQEVDMSGDAHANYGKSNLYMASSEFTVDATGSTTTAELGMSHLISSVELKVTNSTGGDLTLREVSISGLDSRATVAFDDLALTPVAGDITLDLRSSEVLTTTATLIPFSIIPISLSEGENFTISLHFDNYTKTTIVKSAPAGGLDFARATHNTFLCDVESVVGDRWEDSATTTFANDTPYSDSTTAYTIETPEQFAGLAKLVNDGCDMSGKTFTLANDIDLTGRVWSPIGGYISNSSCAAFAGVFDGGGHKIYGVYINKPNEGQKEAHGLFGYTSGATIKNLAISGEVTGDYRVGALVGFNRNASTVINCYCDCRVSSMTGKGRVGGIVGQNSTDSNLINSYFTGSIISQLDDVYVGGVAGHNYSNSSIINSYSSGTLVSTSEDMGGVLGYNSSNSNVTNSYYNSSLYASGNAIGTDYNSGNSSATGKTKSYMQGDNFVPLLNGNASAYNTTHANQEKACAWKRVDDDYPTFNYGVDPE